jgi:hypothetical protein
MNDIKEKGQLPIVPIATLLPSRESTQTDRGHSYNTQKGINELPIICQNMKN